MSNSPVKHTTANTYTLNANTVPNGGYTLIGNANTNYGYGNITIAPSSSYIISNGSSGMNWATTTSPNMTVGKVKITETDIDIDGLSLANTLKGLQARLAIMQARLAIMTPNPVLEKEFDELKACGDRYRELEKEFTEQLKMWNTLKSTDR